MSAAMQSNYTENKTTHDEFIKFINLPENRDKTYELIDGYIVMTAGNATGTHHRICAFIVREIGSYLRGKSCEVFQDINVHLFHKKIGKCKNVFQPDVMIGCDKDKVTDNGYEGTPEFAAEVISKSTARRDYIEKLQYYLKYGVKEYWIVDSFQKKILVYINDAEESPKVFMYTFNDIIKVSVLDDLSIDFKEIAEIIR